MPDSPLQTPPAAPQNRSYLPAERQDMILSLLTQRNVASVAEIAELLSTSEVTVRRDLTLLAKAGLLKRVRGGAMSVGATPESASIANDQADGFDDGTAGPADGATGSGNPDGSASAPGALAGSVPAGLATFGRAPASGLLEDAIGVMLPEPSFFWPGVIDHIRSIAEQSGLRVITRESSYDRQSPDADIMAELVADPAVKGLIVAPSNHTHAGARAWQWIEHSPVPTVVIERDQPMLGTCYVDSVHTNHPYGVRKAAVHFLKHGHTRIGAAFSETPTSAIIQRSWEELVASTDLIECPFVRNGIQPYDAHGIDDIFDSIEESKVTAMLVHSDYLAIAIAQMLERRGKRVPADVSLISIDGFATPSSRPLTVLRSSDKGLAEEAISLLLNRIHHPESATRHIYVDPTLIDRGSVISIR